MTEVWIATWFCLAMADPVCKRLDGAVGNLTFDHQAMCDAMVAWGTREMHRLGVPLMGACMQIGEVYQPMPRPKRVR